MPDSSEHQGSDNTAKAVLIQKRGQIKSKLTRFKTFIDAFTTDRPNENVTQLKLRLAKLEECWSEFENVQSNIELIDNSEIQLEEREQFENLYFTLTSQAQDFIDFHNKTNNTTSSNNPEHQIGLRPSFENSQNLPQVKLPTINLPTFAGNYDTWLSFSDSFQSLIHNNESLSDIQKLHYLKSSLKGEASQVVQSLELTSNNYTVAWELLEKRYKNLPLIIKKHIKALFDLPIVHKDSAPCLRQLLDNVLSNLRALKALNQPTEHWDSLLIHLVTSKLNHSTYRDWEMSRPNQPDTLPKFTELVDFIQKRCHILESSSNKTQSREQLTTTAYRPNKTSCFVNQDHSCRYCEGSHAIFQCQALIKATPAERSQKLKSAGICFNCLKPGHTTYQCRSSNNCRKCNGKHNTLLHFSDTKSNLTLPTGPTQAEVQPSNITLNTNQNTSNSKSELEQVTHSCTTTTMKNSSYILLSTAQVDVIGKNGNVMRCRALLDSGSQSCLMAEKVAQHLKLQRTREPGLQISGIDQSVVQVNSTTHATIKSCISNYQVELKFHVVTKITGDLPSSTINISNLKIPNNVILADQSFNLKGKIDLLLGQEIFFDLLCIGQIKTPGCPTLQKTKLGWIVGGKIEGTEVVQPQVGCNLTTMESIDKQLKAFWELEEPTHTIHLTSKEKYCEEHFKANTKRNEDGRYVVKMPLQSDVSSLGDSKNKAIKRFLQVEKRIQSDDYLKTEYTKFMNEYEELHHMEKCENLNDPDTSDTDYYLPHHPVINNASSTTKVRVVFDASAKTTSGISLNDIQLVGPTIQRDIFSLLLSYRTHNIVLSADIEKMYRQVLVEKSQRNLLKIIWRSDPSQPLETYKLNTITYGTSSAAYLATRTLIQLAEDEKEMFPNAANVVKNDFYVDDLMTGVSTKEEAIQLQTELTDLLSRGGFNLRKWKSNSKEVLNHLPENLVEMKHHQFPHEEDKTTKTLGMWWDTETDEFLFKYNPMIREHPCPVTKRTMLSDIAKLFDPLSIVSPIIVRAKLLLQELWKLKLNWDESVPSHIFTAWRQFLACLQNLHEIRVPRQTTLHSTHGTFELIGFADSSESAYGGVVYLRHQDLDGQVKISLLCSKSRIAPLHTTSLPRLELCAALLLAELMQHVKKALPMTIHEISYWTDSTVALFWIQNEPARWTTFVANRVAKIQSLTKDRTWNYICSRENPADLLSRGTTTKNLVKSKLWWNGPSWLISHKNEWPISSQHLQENKQIPEQKCSSCLVVEDSPHNRTSIYKNLIEKYSSYDKLLRVFAWILRFKHNLMQKDNQNRQKTLQLEETQYAEKIIIRHVQEESFSEEIKNIKKGSPCKSNKVSSLDLFLDEDKILRVGGRIKESNLNYDQKHPILLPKNNHLTEIIAQKEHLRQLHCGPQTLLYSIRERFWPINGRDLTKLITRKCLKCFKAKPRSQDQKMGNLPVTRVNPARPFLHSGVDFCGPFYTKPSNRRGLKSFKSYVAVFICLATKAVHLELVSDLTTDAFIAALKRFISRRGVCATITSDNGKTFVGANRQLQELKRFFDKEYENINHELLKDGIKWKFNPPYSPHMGGLWEAAVKSLKHHLVRVIGNAALTFEELSTLLYQIEAVMNSRPLTPISNHPSDFNVLTPGHFLTGAPLNTIPEPSLKHLNESRLSRWQRLQSLLQHFWTRWSHEYLNNLQARNKWKNSTSSLEVGDLVLLKEENAPPLDWQMGRITHLHPGKDNLTRVVTLKTAKNTLNRSVHKLCKLPIEV